MIRPVDLSNKELLCKIKLDLPSKKLGFGSMVCITDKVYLIYWEKRQQGSYENWTYIAVITFNLETSAVVNQVTHKAVSYTHLTLPTKA